MSDETGEDQELRETLRHGIPREPDLKHGGGEAQRGEQTHRGPEHPAGQEEGGECAEDAEDGRCGQSAAHAHGFEEIRAEGGEEVEELRGDQTALRMIQFEAHETGPRGLRSVVIHFQAELEGRFVEVRVEEGQVVCRNRGHDRIDVGDGAGAGDHAHGRDVGPRVATAHDVFARPGVKKKGDEGHGEGGHEFHEAIGCREREARPNTHEADSDADESEEPDFHRGRRHRIENPQLGEKQGHPRREGDGERAGQEDSLVELQARAISGPQERKEDEAREQQEDEGCGKS